MIGQNKRKEREREREMRRQGKRRGEKCLYNSFFQHLDLSILLFDLTNLFNHS